MDSADLEPAEPCPMQPEHMVQRAEERTLQLDLHVDEAVWMKQIGHLKDWCSDTQAIHLGVPARVPTPLAANSIRLLWLFPNLHHLDITYNSTRSRIDQPVLLACAELLNLTTLHVSGGHLHRKGLDLGVLTSLRRLHTLSVRPHSDEGLDGLEDEHLATAARLTGLRSLSLRASENVTDEGVRGLCALTGLTQLSLAPLGLYVSHEGVSALSSALPALASLSVGLHESRQVAALKGLAERCLPATQPAVNVVLNSPEASASGFLSTLTLVLRPMLVGLRMATVEATDSTFLLAVGTLTALTELKLGVSLPEGGRPFTCNLAALSSLNRLHTLEFAVTRELALPLSVKLVSMLSLSWPQLRSLSLSVMAKPEVAPEALDLLDNFGHLHSLSLFAPLDYACDEEADIITLPVNPRYLPRGLTHLVLECAELQERLPRTSPSGPGQPSQQAPCAETPRSCDCEPARAPLLPGLKHLELDNCRTTDEQLDAMLASATGLRHLELSDVRGITAAGLASLRCLTRLEHLVVRLGESDGDAGARSGPRHAGNGGGAGALSHQSLSLLRNASTLRHLEWSLPEPVDAVTLERFCMPVLTSLGGLQELSLDVAPDLRLSGLRSGGAAPSRPQAAAGGQDAEEANGSGRELGWVEKLQESLPLCTIADRPGIVVYDLWNDRMVHVVGC